MTNKDLLRCPCGGSKAKFYQNVYTVSQDSKSKLWYAHKVGFAYVPYFGSFCEKKSDAMEYAKMLNGFNHNVNRVEKRKKRYQNERQL